LEVQAEVVQPLMVGQREVTEVGVLMLAVQKHQTGQAGLLDQAQAWKHLWQWAETQWEVRAQHVR
jgi:hypothetical protein